MSFSDFDSDFDDEPPPAWKTVFEGVLRAEKRDSHSPRGGGMAVLAPDAPKKRAQSALMGWPALMQSPAQDFLPPALAKKRVEDFLVAMVKPPSASRTSSLTVDLVAAGIEARPLSRQSLITFAPTVGAVSTHPFATAANTPGGTRSRSFTADDDEVEDVEASKSEPLMRKRKEKVKQHCRVCGGPGQCGGPGHRMCGGGLKGRLPPSSPSFDLNVNQHQVLAPRTPQRSGAVLGPPAHSACCHRTVLYSACPARAARDADVLVAFEQGVRLKDILQHVPLLRKYFIDKLSKFSPDISAHHSR